MRSFLLITLIAGLADICKAQSQFDKQVVIQKCLDIDSLQPYYRETEDGRKPLVIYNSGIVPSDLKLKKFGQPVLFLINEEIFFNGLRSVLSFERFEITVDIAEVVFQYQIERIKISVSMRKTNETWVVLSQSIIENTK